MHLFKKSSDDIQKAMVEKIKKYGQECVLFNAIGALRATKAANKISLSELILQHEYLRVVRSYSFVF